MVWKPCRPFPSTSLAQHASAWHSTAPSLSCHGLETKPQEHKKITCKPGRVIILLAGAHALSLPYTCSL